MKIIRNNRGYIELSDLLVLDGMNYNLPLEFYSKINSPFYSSSTCNSFIPINDENFLKEVSLMDFIPDFDYLSSLALDDLIALYNSALNESKTYTRILCRDINNDENSIITKLNSVKSNHKVNSYAKFIGYYCGRLNYEIPNDTTKEAPVEKTNAFVS